MLLTTLIGGIEMLKLEDLKGISIIEAVYIMAWADADVKEEDEQDGQN